MKQGVEVMTDEAKAGAKAPKAGGTYGQGDIGRSNRTSEEMTTHAEDQSQAGMESERKHQKEEGYGEDDVEGDAGLRGFGSPGNPVLSEPGRKTAPKP